MDRRVFWALVAYTFALLFFYLLYRILAPFGVPLVWAAVMEDALWVVGVKKRQWLREEAEKGTWRCPRKT